MHVCEHVQTSFEKRKNAGAESHCAGSVDTLWFLENPIAKALRNYQIHTGCLVVCVL